MDRRAAALLGVARTIARAPADSDVILQRVEAVFRERFPGLQIVVEEPLPVRENETSGVVTKDRFLYLWALVLSFKTGEWRC